MIDPKLMSVIDGENFPFLECDMYRTGFGIEPGKTGHVILDLRFPGAGLGGKDMDMVFGFSPEVAEGIARNLLEKARMARAHATRNG